MRNRPVTGSTGSGLLKAARIQPWLCIWRWPLYLVRLQSVKKIPSVFVMNGMQETLTNPVINRAGVLRLLAYRLISVLFYSWWAGGGDWEPGLRKSTFTIGDTVSPDVKKEVIQWLNRKKNPDCNRNWTAATGTQTERTEQAGKTPEEEPGKPALQLGMKNLKSHVKGWLSSSWVFFCCCRCFCLLYPVHYPFCVVRGEKPASQPLATGTAKRQTGLRKISILLIPHRKKQRNQRKKSHFFWKDWTAGK